MFFIRFDKYDDVYARHCLNYTSNDVLVHGHEPCFSSNFGFKVNLFRFYLHHDGKRRERIKINDVTHRVTRICSKQIKYVTIKDQEYVNSAKAFLRLRVGRKLTAISHLDR